MISGRRSRRSLCGAVALAALSGASCDECAAQGGYDSLPAPAAAVPIEEYDGLPALEPPAAPTELQSTEMVVSDVYLGTAPEEISSPSAMPMFPPMPLEDCIPQSLPEVETEPVVNFGYDATCGHTTWIIGHDDRLGIVSWETRATIKPGEHRGVTAGFGVHFLDGPVVTDMPPRLFEFTLGYQRREWLVENIGYDVVVRIGAFSDFEGSARDGLRFPGHAVFFARASPEWDWLLGVDVLDRDDISLLPVFGAVWAPHERVRIDAVFPRPAAAIRLAETTQWAYVRGQLGGGTWAIEREPAYVNDNATYRDLRLIFGIETRDNEFLWSAVEVGYVFGRELSYRSSPTDFELRDTVMISLTGIY